LQTENIPADSAEVRIICHELNWSG